MADTAVIHTGENSPEYIAYRLMHHCLEADKITAEKKTRKAILDTYAECLFAVRGHRKFETK